MPDTDTVESLQFQLAEAQRYIHKLRKELGPLREMGNPISEHEAQWQLRLQEANRHAAASAGCRDPMHSRSDMWRRRVEQAFAYLRKELMCYRIEERHPSLGQKVVLHERSLLGILEAQECSALGRTTPKPRP